MLTLLLAAALSVAPPAEQVFDPPVAILTMDPVRDKPILCAKQFLINRERLMNDEEERDDLIEAYAATLKMSAEDRVNLLHECNVFTIGAAFGVLLTLTEAEEAAKADSPLANNVIESSGVAP